MQSWLNSPGANFGWLLHGDELSGFTSKRYDTRENSTSANRPQLTITYVVPAPGALGAILLGGTLAATRRRRSA